MSHEEGQRSRLCFRIGLDWVRYIQRWIVNPARRASPAGLHDGFWINPGCRTKLAPRLPRPHYSTDRLDIAVNRLVTEFLAPSFSLSVDQYPERGHRTKLCGFYQ